MRPSGSVTLKHQVHQRCGSEAQQPLRPTLTMSGHSRVLTCINDPHRPRAPRWLRRANCADGLEATIQLLCGERCKHPARLVLEDQVHVGERALPPQKRPVTPRVEHGGGKSGRSTEQGAACQSEERRDERKANSDHTPDQICA